MKKKERSASIFSCLLYPCYKYDDSEGEESPSEEAKSNISDIVYHRNTPQETGKDKVDTRILYQQFEKLLLRLKSHQQDNLLDHLQSISFGTKEHLLKQMQYLELEQIDYMYHYLIIRPVSIQEIYYEPVRSVLSQKSAKMILERKIAIILLLEEHEPYLYTNGRGTQVLNKLGNKSIYQSIAQKIVQLEKNLIKKDSQANKPLLNLFILTNPEIHAYIQFYFMKNNFFGLYEEQVFFFPQSQLIALDFNGKYILKSQKEIQLLATGKGGVYQAMKRVDLLDHLQGIEFCHFIDGENAKINVCDPEMIGRAKTGKLDICCKFSSRGGEYFCLKNGKNGLISQRK